MTDSTSHQPGAEPMTKPRWFKAEISLGNMISLALVLFGIIVGAVKLQASDETQTKAIVEIKKKQEEDNKTLREEVRNELRELRNKSDTVLDRLVDRQQQTVERVVRVETKIDTLIEAVGAVRRAQ
jgi:Sec-independent protein translocase protein TatA